MTNILNTISYTPVNIEVVKITEVVALDYSNTGWSSELTQKKSSCAQNFWQKVEDLRHMPHGSYDEMMTICYLSEFNREL